LNFQCLWMLDLVPHWRTALHQAYRLRVQKCLPTILCNLICPFPLRNIQFYLRGLMKSNTLDPSKNKTNHAHTTIPASNFTTTFPTLKMWNSNYILCKRVLDKNDYSTEHINIDILVKSHYSLQLHAIQTASSVENREIKLWEGFSLQL